MKRTNLILAIVLLLNGCAAFLVGGVAGGLAVYDKRPLSVINSDEHIRHQIEVKLLRKNLLKKNNLFVSTFNGNVLLTGQTEHASVRYKAEEIARKHPYAKKIYNEIEISPKTDTWSGVKDGILTTKVKTALMAHKEIYSGMLKVVTVNRAVYLMGELDQKQQRLASSLVRSIKDVRKVVTAFEDKPKSAGA